MAKKKKKRPLNKEQKRVIHLQDYKEKVSELKSKGIEHYSPKIGRQIKQLNKKIFKEAA